MARPRSLRVLFVRPGDRQALHPGLTFDVPRTGGDVLPVELLRLASAVKFGSRHQALVHDERHPSVAGAGPGSLLRGISRSLSPDVAVIWMHPACLADSLEAARQARHAGCSAVLGAGPLVSLWPQAAGRVLEVDGLVGSAAGLIAALDVLEARGSAEDLDRSLGATTSNKWPLDRKLLDYAAYRSLSGPPWPGTERPPRTTSDKGRFAASAVDLDAEDISACRLLGIRFLDLRGPAASTGWAALTPTLEGARVRLRTSPEELRRASLDDLRRAGVEALDVGRVAAGVTDDVEGVCAVAETARKAGFFLGASALIGVAGYGAGAEDRGMERLRSAGLSLEVRVPVRPSGERWLDHIDAPSAAWLPPGVDPDRLGRTSTAHGASRGVRGFLQRSLR